MSNLDYVLSVGFVNFGWFLKSIPDGSDMLFSAFVFSLILLSFLFGEEKNE